jgi:PPK2 family polyphosphate:nucleotide phosphotransferase
VPAGISRPPSARLQQILHAGSPHALLLVFQGMDASGKDGAIRRALRFVNPAGVQISYFKEPAPDEEAHDFLWRVHRVVPPRGIIGVFNRSHYEAVLAERILGHLPASVVRRRLREIADFERMLADNGVVVVKFFLHLGRAEQARRFRKRLHQPHKQWKFRLGDLDARRHWASYMAAYEDLLNATSRRPCALAHHPGGPEMVSRLRRRPHRPRHA